MKKAFVLILSVLVFVLASCSNGIQSKDTSYAYRVNECYLDVIATPEVIKQILADKNTPVLGADNAKQAVVIFFSYDSNKKYTEVARRLNILAAKNPDVKFIFKAYSPNNSTVTNYAALAADVAYLQGGQKLFKAYNDAVLLNRNKDDKLTEQHINDVIQQLGIKIDNTEYIHQAKLEKTATTNLVKTIGFEGEHSMIMLPTNLVDMDANELLEHKSKIYILPGAKTVGRVKYNPEVVNWIIDNIDAHIKIFRQQQ